MRSAVCDDLEMNTNRNTNNITMMMMLMMLMKAAAKILFENHWQTPDDSYHKLIDA